MVLNPLLNGFNDGWYYEVKRAEALSPGVLVQAAVCWFQLSGKVLSVSTPIVSNKVQISLTRFQKIIFRMAFQLTHFSKKQGFNKIILKYQQHHLSGLWEKLLQNKVSVTLFFLIDTYVTTCYVHNCQKLFKLIWFFLWNITFRTVFYFEFVTKILFYINFVLILQIYLSS